MSKILFFQFQFILSVALLAQIDSNAIKKVPLMTTVILEKEGSLYKKVVYKGKNVKIAKGKNNEILITPTNAAIGGRKDTLFCVQGKDTMMRVLEFTEPMLQIRFDNFDEHSSSYVFLSLDPPRKITAHIVNLSPEEALVNKVYLKEATFFLYASDSLVKIYKVNNENLGAMFSDLHGQYRPGYYLEVSRITVLINNILLPLEGEYFRYLFK